MFKIRIVGLGYEMGFTCDEYSYDYDEDLLVTDDNFGTKIYVGETLWIDGRMHYASC